jgi:hypothetical protein
MSDMQAYFSVEPIVFKSAKFREKATILPHKSLFVIKTTIMAHVIKSEEKTRQREDRLLWLQATKDLLVVYS